MPGLTIVQILLHDGQGGAESLARSLHNMWMEDPRLKSSVLSLEACGWPSASKLTVLRRLRSRLRVLQPNAVFMHTALPGVYGRLVAQVMRPDVRWFLVLHSASDDYADARLRLAEMMLQRRTTGAVAVSTANAEGFLAKFRNADVVVIPNGVDLKVFEDVRINFRAPQTFVATSRLHPQKDLETLVRGFARFAAERNGVRLLIAGSASDRAYSGRIAHLIEELAPGQIELLGAREDVASLLAQADVFVHSALREAHPISIVEAAVCGLPIIATRIPGVEAIVGPHATLFEPGNAQELADALTAAADDPEIAWTEAQKLKRLARDRYALKRTADAYEALARGSRIVP